MQVKVINNHQLFKHKQSSGTTAVIAAQIEGRINIDIANNIKFDAGDFILDQALANEGTGTYAQSGTTITITENGHGLSNGFYSLY